MRILVVGAGAIGGYFGGRLLQAGRDVTFLVRPSRAEALARQGLSIQSPYGNAHLPAPPTVIAEDLRAPFDLVILSCKAQDLATSMESLAPAVGSQTAILPTLNGMRHMDDLAARFGREHLLGGECMISVSRDAEGHIVHLNDLHRLSFGELHEDSTSRIERIYSTLSNAGFETRRSGTIQQDMWDKWIFIATAAGMTCLMRASIGDIVAADAAGLILRFRDECAGIAASEGFRLSPETLDRIAKMMTQAGSPFTASMLRDIEAHAPLEAEHVIGDLVHRAKAHGLTTPLLEVAYAHVRAYEVRRKRERTGDR